MGYMARSKSIVPICSERTDVDVGDESDRLHLMVDWWDVRNFLKWLR